MLLELLDTLGTCEVEAEPVTIAVNFADVPFDDIFREFINAALRHGITGGCGGGNYCPGSPVTRAQMAVFLLKAKFGADHEPPPATGTVFADVPQNAPLAAWIEELASLEITGGCGGGNYCPDATVTRAQMAIFLLKTLLGSAHTPPAATGVFGDVPVGLVRRCLDRGSLRPRRHGRLQREPAALLPQRPEHARSDGGVPGEDV